MEYFFDWFKNNTDMPDCLEAMIDPDILRCARLEAISLATPRLPAIVYMYFGPSQFPLVAAQRLRVYVQEVISSERLIVDCGGDDEGLNDASAIEE